MTTPHTRRVGLTLMELVVVLVILAVLATLVIPLLSTTGSQAQQTATLATMSSLRNAIVSYHQDMKGTQVGATGSGAYPGTTGVPATLKDLLNQPSDMSVPSSPVPVRIFDPKIRLGWRGPYLLQATGSFTPTLDSSFNPYGSWNTVVNGQTVPDPAFVDGWGNPIVLIWPPATTDSLTTRAQYVCLVSAGAPVKNVNGTQVSTLASAWTASATSSAAWVPNIAQRGGNLVLFLFTQDPYQ